MEEEHSEDKTVHVLSNDDAPVQEEVQYVDVEELETDASHEEPSEDAEDESTPHYDGSTPDYDTDKKLSELASRLVRGAETPLGYLESASVAGFKESSVSRKKQKRARMVGAAVRRCLVEALYHGKLFKRHPEFENLQQILTIEDVEMTSDLGNARIYWSCKLEVDKRKIENIEKMLRQCKGAFRAVIGKEVNIKKCPEVSFKPSPLLLAGLQTTPEMKEILRQNGFEDAGHGVFVSADTIDPLTALHLGMPLAGSREEFEVIKEKMVEDQGNSYADSGSKSDRYNSANMKVKRLLQKIYLSRTKNKEDEK
ncbi:hypothetical protein GUITHDRAFT_113179 [Guillardia theta CCMP2712]|uniref:Uncharacterized protein n=2 Tax=Guillardia theta TaxID=55529 RepID=L1IXT0_GUITC|nr:hypothetical protein GUITHDRAFT_113179 [Guillardia theta CCMP2712]EKX40645.1 hypothetical protein GUITHDRAFT_113179 [Guillardia theta CCMP2712]|eukprot:XP_005827625.1 hypothetical protein GUITHDRAFT_113179 [Guillardia theta CCMP2712]